MLASLPDVNSADDPSPGDLSRVVSAIRGSKDDELILKGVVYLWAHKTGNSEVEAFLDQYCGSASAPRLVRDWFSIMKKEKL